MNTIIKVTSFSSFTMETLIKLSDRDKNLLLESLPIISTNLDLFVVKFYFYLLKTDARRLFKETELEKQYRMFHRSLAVVISHIENPQFLQTHVNNLITTHIQYGVSKRDVDFFVDSFMKALSDIYGKDFITYRDAWYSIIIEIMDYFGERMKN